MNSSNSNSSSTSFNSLFNFASGKSVMDLFMSPDLSQGVSMPLLPGTADKQLQWLLSSFPTAGTQDLRSLAGGSLFGLSYLNLVASMWLNTAQQGALRPCQTTGCSRPGNQLMGERPLCGTCAVLYSQGHICEFCKEVCWDMGLLVGKPRVQCNSCQKWNHTACETNKKFESEKYFCRACSSKIQEVRVKPPTKPSGKKREGAAPVLSPHRVKKETVRREKNVELPVSRDNKSQLYIRLSLLEAEAKNDLEDMRQVGKKPRCNPEVKLAEVPTVPDGMMGLRPRQQRKNYRKMNGEM